MQMLQAAVITQSYAFARLLTGLRWVTNIRDCCLEDGICYRAVISRSCQIE